MALHKPPLGLKPRDETKGSFFQTELFKRILGSLAVFIAIVGGILLGGYVWSAVASVIAICSLWEFYKLICTKYKLSRGWGLAGSLFILISVSIGMSYSVTLSILTLLTFTVLFTEVVRRQMTGQSFALWNIGGTLSGVLYVVLPWSFMIVIRNQTFGHIFLLTLFLCTWCCDVGAYVIGTRFGSSPLCSRVSPKKSWEGFWGGVLLSMVCGGLIAAYTKFSPVPLVLLGLLCGVAGQLGDLGESVLKREAQVKDSGSIIPGHGGFLDRFDSILVNASLAYLIFEVIG